MSFRVVLGVAEQPFWLVLRLQYTKGFSRNEQNFEKVRGIGPYFSLWKYMIQFKFPYLGHKFPFAWDSKLSIEICLKFCDLNFPFVVVLEQVAHLHQYIILLIFFPFLKNC